MSTKSYPIDRILRETERCLMTGVSRSTWYRWTRKGIVPKPVRLGEKMIGWSMSELQAWIEDRNTV